MTGSRHDAVDGAHGPRTGIAMGPAADTASDAPDDAAADAPPDTTTGDPVVAEIDRIRGLLARQLDRVGDPQRGVGVDDRMRSDLTGETGRPDTGPVDDLARRFGLSGFERDVLVLCAAVELDSGVADTVRSLLDTVDARPTFGVALGALPDAHWDALAPDRPLRSWHLIELADGDTLTSRRIGIDERILHHLLGLSGTDPRLDGVVVPLPPPTPSYESHAAAARELARTLVEQERPTLVNLHSADGATARAVAAAVCRYVDAVPLGVQAGALPVPGTALFDVTRLLDREWILSRRMVVVTDTEARPSAVAGLVAASRAPVLLAVSAPIDVVHAASPRLVLHESLEPPTPNEQRALLRAVVGDDGAVALRTAIEDVSQRHRLDAEAIVSIGADLARHRDDRVGRLRRLARERSRTRLDSLAQRITSTASWPDLVIADGHLELLREIARQVRNRTRVHDDWGFGDRSSRGLGVTALFAGESGTGKTLAAEVIANDLSLDLYRVDLSATVSKYIGETEKNLARLFDAAEGSGAVLLFDEADALFGKRTEVRDSHDRYANVEVAYLLQRMESYRGLAILTTNLRSNLDRAFVRRLRFIVQFPFPDERQRAEIWRRTFPVRTPLQGIEPEALAKLTIPGGSIWSIALSAAFAAADDDGPVTTAHVLAAARTEYAKHDRTLTPTEMAALR
jgi:hypothetical protein